MPLLSIVVPARNEEHFIGGCLESIQAAAVRVGRDVETIVVINRCSDRTEQIARNFGARIVYEDARNLSRIRNAGAREAYGEILVTIDADSRMSPDTLAAIEHVLASGRAVGGGVRIYPDRYSLGIRAAVAIMNLVLFVTRLSGGLFWCRREDFEAIGGFDEKLVSGEDVDFARRLRAHGRKSGRRFRTLPGAHIVTSCRKFDKFGDWFVLRRPLMVWRILQGRSQNTADVFYYEVER